MTAPSANSSHGRSERRGVRSPQLQCLVALAMLLAACGVIADAEQLPSTRWTVMDIDGETVPENQIWLYLERDTAELVTQPEIGNRNVGRHCLAGTADFIWDSAGHAMSFGAFANGEEGRCDPGMPAWHDRIARALRDNQRWDASADMLDLVGSSRIRLLPDRGSD